MTTEWDKLTPPEVNPAKEPWPSLDNWIASFPIPMDLAEERVRNKVPTHDPYTNPDSLIYYECKCGAILDPGTKSFAALNNRASEAGWKVRWGAEHYIPYCVDCGKGIE